TVRTSVCSGRMPPCFLPARVAGRNLLPCELELPGQVVVCHDESTHGGPWVAVTGRNGLLGRGLQVELRWFHGMFPVCSHDITNPAGGLPTNRASTLCTL